MDDADLNEALALCRLGGLEAGAEAELKNWSGCLPPLLLALLNAVEVQANGGTVSSQMVNAAAEQALAGVQDVLAQLWDECSEATKDLYRDLHRGRHSAGGMGWNQRERLLTCGFAVAEGRNRLRKSCRLLERFVTHSRADKGSVARLFRSAEGYQANISSILELRLDQIGVVDV